MRRILIVAALIAAGGGDVFAQGPIERRAVGQGYYLVERCAATCVSIGQHAQWWTATTRADSLLHAVQAQGSTDSVRVATYQIVRWIWRGAAAPPDSTPVPPTPPDTVTPPTPPSTRTVLNPDTLRLLVGQSSYLDWGAFDAGGAEINAQATFATFDPSIASAPPGPSGGTMVRGESVGITRVSAMWQAHADTSVIVVTGTAPPPPVDTTVTALGVRISADPRVAGGNDYSIDARVYDHADVEQAGLPVTVWVTGATFGPGTTRETRNSPLRINWCCPAVGDTLYATAASADTASYVHTGSVPEPEPIPVPPPSTGDSTVITPAGLEPILGRLIRRSATSGPVATFDQRFAANEAGAFADAQALVAAGAANMANHYDALFGRFQRAIRDGAPTGPLFQHGREIALAYAAWSRMAGSAPPPHNNTGMLGMELLLALEQNADARMHIHCVAGFDSGTDPWGYLQGTHSNTGPRIPAVALQAISAAHRNGIPWGACPANINSTPLLSLGSWLNSGRRLIGWIELNWVKPDGSVPSPSHSVDCGFTCEAYFMNAMLAVELLRWYRDVEPDPRVLELAGRIVGHLADEWQRTGGPLPYFTNRAPGSANDLAAFHIWPALVIWQESGETRLRDFAVAHMLAAASAGNQDRAKQFQQVHSTHAAEAEAILAGVLWR